MCKKKTLIIPKEMILPLRKYLKWKIMSTETKLGSYLEKRMQILQLIKQTVERGESNSALLLGPRGSGKTTLVYNILKDLGTQENFNKNAITVKLNGLIHVDDRLALKDITRQMQLENVVGDKVFGTFAENLSFLLDCLKAGDKKYSKPVIFLLDEFHLFCEHHNQTLLYNLFDIAQSDHAPICVIGLTCRLDVLELLEKRVKSRFSHRQIFLFISSYSEESMFNERLKLFQHLLSVPTNKNLSNRNHQYNEYMIDPYFGHMWNQHIETLTSNPTIVNLLSRMYKYDTSEHTFRNFLITAVSMLSEYHYKLELNDFIETYKAFYNDDKVLMMEGLSVLEMCLIIAMKYETEIYDGEPFNFETIYNRYSNFVNQHSSIQSVQKPVIMKAFEHIKNLEILMPINSTNPKVQKEHRYYNFLLVPEQVKEAVQNFSGLPTEVSQWALSPVQ